MPLSTGVVKWWKFPFFDQWGIPSNTRHRYPWLPRQLVRWFANGHSDKSGVKPKSSKSDLMTEKGGRNLYILTRSNRTGGCVLGSTSESPWCEDLEWWPVKCRTHYKFSVNILLRSTFYTTESVHSKNTFLRPVIKTW